uniref:Uncharacterized protein n=1 Tax=Arundo donax TaxID=35708 RepID=A0A0A8XXS1_ARUDO
MVVLAPHTTETGSPKSPTFAQIEESEQLKKMEEEKAAAAATKPESSSEEAFDETKGDNNDVTKSEGSSTTASGAVEEDKPLKDGSASNKPTDPLKVIKRASDKPTDPPKVIKQRRRPKPLDRERAELNALIFVSLLVAVFTLITLWRNRGKPLLFLGFVWQLSLLISLSSFLWINFLKVMHTLVVFLSLSQVCLLAAFAHHTLSPAIGMFTVQLSTHFAAGFLGCALAQRRLLQPQATDRYEIPMPDNEEAERLHVLRIAAGLLYGLPTLGVAIRLAWVLSHSADYAPTDLMLHFLMPLSGGLLLWISFIASVLRGALMGQGGLALVFFYFGFIMMNYMLMLVTLGHTVATLATWFAILGLSGFLGYSIGVYNFFKEIQMTRVTRDSVPQASPLQ